MILVRYCYAPEYTLGDLSIQNREKPLPTIEPPWIPGEPGGLSFVSCVPDGDYDLVEHRGGRHGDRVLALRNPALGVYYREAEVPEAGGRFLCEIHAANWARQLRGCIGPGLSAGIDQDVHRTYSSRRAVAKILAAFDAGDDRLSIRCTDGAVG